MRNISDGQDFHQSFNSRLVVKKSSLLQLEFIFATIGLLFYMSTLEAVFNSLGVGMLITLSRYTILLVSVAVLLSDARAARETLVRAKYLVPLIGLTLLSFLWSRLPASTIQGLRSDFIPITVFGIYLATRFSRKQLFELIYLSLIITSAISLFYAIFIPSIGRHSGFDVYAGAWKGIYTHKNGFGLNLALCSTFAGTKLLFSSRYRLIQAGILGVLYVGILFSQSTSALVLSTLTLFLIWSYESFKWRGKRTVLWLSLLMVLLIGVVGSTIVLWTPLLAALGKDPTMSGRTLIWQFLLEQRIPQAPFLGYGKGVFWRVPALFAPVFQIAHHVPAHAHNGYMELLVDLGFVGLFLFIVSLLPLLAKVLVLAYQSARPEDTWPLAVIIITLSINGIESSFLRGANFFWLLYVVIACLQSRRKIRTAEPRSRREPAAASARSPA